MSLAFGLASGITSHKHLIPCPARPGLFHVSGHARSDMNAHEKDIRRLRPGETLEDTASTGVSLHCHTLHSRELLDFVPYYAERIPVVRYLWSRSMDRRLKENGRMPDFKNGYWEPPLTADIVFRSEADSLSRLGLRSIVSITDHDSISAGLELQRDRPAGEAPVSMEWTVPFGHAFFHIGVHNLPSDSARLIAEDLMAYTNAAGEPDDRWLGGLLAMLDSIEGVLVVLNHPMWDIEMIGQELHERSLADFLDTHRRWIHAIEVNGFRSNAENQEAVALALELGLPIVSGGDRHCCQPNTMINLTNAATFDEFVHEIRRERRSQIAVLPEYDVPLPSRQLASMRQILGSFPEFANGRAEWPGRVYLDAGDGLGPVTLAEQWGGRTPLWTYPAIWVLGLLAHRAMRPVISALIGDVDIGRNETAPAVGLSPLASPVPTRSLETGSV